jgi:hypothetical protein
MVMIAQNHINPKLRRQITQFFKTTLDEIRAALNIISTQKYHLWVKFIDQIHYLSDS